MQPGQAARSYLVPETDPLVGAVLEGRYSILARLGEGAMSTVYKAQHRVTGRVAAVKVLRRGLSMDSASTKRFEREAKAISSLSHPNLITVHDFGTTGGGQPYQVIEYLEGRSLAEVISAGPLAPERAVAIFRQICDAIQHAHSKGIIHRDLKPENIMLITHDGRPDFVKVVDFGIVKLTEESQIASQRLTATGEVWGSPLYASPEQCMGKELDHRSDIYSLGLVLYEALTGKPAVSGKNIGQIAMKHVRDKPPPFDASYPDHRIPALLQEITMRSLEKDPDRRFQSMAKMGAALAAVFAGASAAAGAGKSLAAAAGDLGSSAGAGEPVTAGANKAGTPPAMSPGAPGVTGTASEASEHAPADAGTRPGRQRFTVEQVKQYRQQGVVRQSSDSVKQLRESVQSQGARSLPRVRLAWIVGAGILLLSAVLFFLLFRAR